MPFREIATFDVLHARLSWPWIAFAADSTALSFASSATTIETRRLDGEKIVTGPSFTLPDDLAVATTSDGDPSGLTAFALSTNSVGTLAVAAHVDGSTVVAILDTSGERLRVRIDDVLGAGHELQALAFDRTGRRLWWSAETATETVTALVDTSTLALVGIIRSAPFPRPALHEIHRHAQDDAVLILAACGDDGTFARVVGYAGDEVSVVPSALDGGAVPAGFVGFSADGARVHLVEADELRTHAWPTLHELSSVPLTDDFVSSFSGAVLGTEIFVDGHDAETRGDAVMLYDRAAIHGLLVPPPAPSGMWAGRLGASAIVTIEPKGDPARACVLLRRTDGPAKALGARRFAS